MLKAHPDLGSYSEHFQQHSSSVSSINRTNILVILTSCFRQIGTSEIFHQIRCNSNTGLLNHVHILFHTTVETSHSHNGAGAHGRLILETHLISLDSSVCVKQNWHMNSTKTQHGSLQETDTQSIYLGSSSVEIHPLTLVSAVSKPMPRAKCKQSKKGWKWTSFTKTLFDTICYSSNKQVYETSWVINTGKSVMVDVLHGLSPSTLAPNLRKAAPPWEEPFPRMIRQVPNFSNLQLPGPTCNGHVWTTLELQYPTLYKPQHL